jgi:AICAR transformylase/IMP cyclohydrolase PurH
MASAKNWHSTAVLTSPAQYGAFLQSLKDRNGRISLELRFQLASQAMKSIGEYRTAIGNYFAELDFGKDVKPFLNIK